MLFLCSLSVALAVLASIHESAPTPIGPQEPQLPDLTNAEFAGKNIVLKSGPSGTSGHATTVGQHYYGLFTRISPGPTEVRAYEASAFIGSGFLGGPEA